MNHKRLHKRLVTILSDEGNLTTGQVLEKLHSSETSKSTGSKCNFYNQPIRVVTNVLRRKPIIKVGFDCAVKQAVWGVDRSL
jgi:hypothetical protein